MSLKSTFLRYGKSLISTRPDAVTVARHERDLFPPTDAAVDGDACLHDCESCTVHLPRSFKIEESDKLYGLVKGWETHLIVATGKTDWVRDIEDEKGSLMEAIGQSSVKPANGRMMLSASNMPTPHDAATGPSAILLPSFEVIDDLHAADVPALLAHVSAGPTNTSPLSRIITPTPTPHPASTLKIRACPHDYLILLCSHRTRDARCGQSAPLLRRELERHLRPAGLYRDLDDARPGGAGIYFINHVGGHKYSANVMVYRSARVAGAADGETNGKTNGKTNGETDGEANEKAEGKQAAQCIWLARVRPEDCENLVRYTLLQGKVVKPERQLRGGFDRARGLVSW